MFSYDDVIFSEFSKIMKTFAYSRLCFMRNMHNGMVLVILDRGLHWLSFDILDVSFWKYNFEGFHWKKCSAILRNQPYI